MLTKENLQEFAKKARIADAPFSVNHEGRPPDYYITSQVGDVKFIYRTKICRGYYNEMPGDKAELAAVVAGRMVYLDYPLLTGSAVNLPEGVMLLDDKVKELNEQASSLVQGFYKKLEPAKNERFPEFMARELDLNARKCALGLLSLDSFAHSIIDEQVIYSCDAIAVLAGVANLQSVATRYCNERIKAMSQTKPYVQAIQERMSTQTTTQPWEQELAKALSGLKARTVIVEFSRDGKTKEGKIDPSVILELLAQNSCFETPDFASLKQSREIFGTLCPDATHKLYCTDISRILFYGKVLYKRG